MICPIFTLRHISRLTRPITPKGLFFWCINHRIGIFNFASLNTTRAESRQQKANKPQIGQAGFMLPF